MNLVSIDFEYNHSSDKVRNLVCCSYAVYDEHGVRHYNHWLDGDSDEKEVLAEALNILIDEKYVFVAHAVTAEARCFHMLGIDPIRVKWLDTQIEYKMLINHNYKYSCGKHYFKTGKIRDLKPMKPKWDQTEEDKGKSGKPETNLQAALYKMLDVVPKAGYKDDMRDLILSGEPLGDYKNKIMEYCASDVKYLKPLIGKIYRANCTALGSDYRREDNPKIFKEALLRGEYAARSAIIEDVGYPIDYEATRNFSAYAPSIISDIQKEILHRFPEVEPFRYDEKKKRYSAKQEHIRSWISKQGHEGWMSTDKGAVSLSLDAFLKYYPYQHNYPKDCLGAQMVRLLKTKTSLNGFLPGKKNNFWDSVGGDDHRVRPYMGIYGSQSARSYPSATAFIPAKAAWMRSLIAPDKGRTIIAVDFSQQEFLLAALVSEDQAMIKAYHSGDPYLHTAKVAGEIPKDGKREDYEEIREIFKQVVLSIQYGMGAPGLSGTLTTKIGKPCTVERAQELIDIFFEAFPDYQEWGNDVLADYSEDGYLKLPCGWTMWGDNINRKSVANFPIQGFGSSIMRRMVAQSQDCGLEVIYTLHDALYIECDTEKTTASADMLATCMSEAMKYYFIGTPVEDDAVCRLDPTIWGPDWDGETAINAGKLLGMTTPYPIYIDSRSRSDYEKFSQYFTIL